MFTWFFGSADNEWVSFGHFSETFNELGQVLSVFDIDGDTYDNGDRVLNELDVVSVFVISNGCLLDKVLIKTDEGKSDRMVRQE